MVAADFLVSLIFVAGDHWFSGPFYFFKMVLSSMPMNRTLLPPLDNNSVYRINALDYDQSRGWGSRGTRNLEEEQTAGNGGVEVESHVCV